MGGSSITSRKWRDTSRVGRTDGWSPLGESRVQNSAYRPTHRYITPELRKRCLHSGHGEPKAIIDDAATWRRSCGRACPSIPATSHASLSAPNTLVMRARSLQCRNWFLGQRSGAARPCVARRTLSARRPCQCPRSSGCVRLRRDTCTGHRRLRSPPRRSEWSATACRNIPDCWQRAAEAEVERRLLRTLVPAPDQRR